MRILVCSLRLGSGLLTTPGQAKEPNNAITLYRARTTLNNWEDVNIPGQLELEKSWLASVTYTRRFGDVGDLISVKVEGQPVKHYALLSHWEFNGLAGVGMKYPFRFSAGSS